jgi:hypothetical protein
MNSEMIKLLLQLITAMVTQQVNRKQNEAALQGFVPLDTMGKRAEEDDQRVEIAKQELALALDVPVTALGLDV